jgi:pyruvate kinase
MSQQPIEHLIDELADLRADLLGLEESCAELLAGASAPHRSGSRNLLHYLALRRHDLRHLQERLAALGLSSLGRAEGSVLASMDAVLHALHHLAGPSSALPLRSALDFDQAHALLPEHTEALLGPKPAGRTVRIMVTMPSEAADDPRLVRDLLAGGMNCMRINCAHDGPERWGRMIRYLRRAQQELEKPCRVLMDLAGPKLRTGELEPGPRVVKFKPERDCCGRVTAPARVWLTPAEQPTPPPATADAALPIPGKWLAQLAAGDHVRFRDARGSSRSLDIVAAVGSGWWAESRRTCYVITGTVLDLCRPGHRFGDCDTRVGELPALSQPLLLRPGDTLILTRDTAPGRPAVRSKQGTVDRPARIPCTLPEVITHLRPGQRIWLDDGKIGGIVRHVHADEVRVEITQARAAGAKLGADKGINLPDTELHLPALTEQDRRDLDFVAAHADLVGLSFVHRADDVTDLQKRLEEHGRKELGIVLKIETRQGFEQLPQILLAAMRGSCVGVMIARGDLAVECGYERLAELQEEILWICEAAHVPVIWATQVLEHLAKEGFPSRAEITDAAMGERAECVMLNKGPHIADAVHALDDILKRMEGHQHKKRSMLRKLRLADGFPIGASKT